MSFHKVCYALLLNFFILTFLCNAANARFANYDDPKVLSNQLSKQLTYLGVYQHEMGKKLSSAKRAAIQQVIKGLEQNQQSIEGKNYVLDLHEIKAIQANIAKAKGLRKKRKKLGYLTKKKLSKIFRRKNKRKATTENRTEDRVAEGQPDRSAEDGETRSSIGNTAVDIGTHKEPGASRAQTQNQPETWSDTLQSWWISASQFVQGDASKEPKVSVEEID